MGLAFGHVRVGKSLHGQAKLKPLSLKTKQSSWQWSRKKHISCPAAWRSTLCVKGQLLQSSLAVVCVGTVLCPYPIRHGISHHLVIHSLSSGRCIGKGVRNVLRAYLREPFPVFGNCWFRGFQDIPLGARSSWLCLVLIKSFQKPLTRF